MYLDNEPMFLKEEPKLKELRKKRRAYFMNRFSIYMLGFLSALCICLSVWLAYFLFCPHAQKNVIIVRPNGLVPNGHFQSIPKGPAPRLH